MIITIIIKFLLLHEELLPPAKQAYGWVASNTYIQKWSKSLLNVTHEKIIKISAELLKLTEPHFSNLPEVKKSNVRQQQFEILVSEAFQQIRKTW